MQTSNPQNALALVSQFCAEYANTMKSRPATRDCVIAQMRLALAELKTAITPTPPVPDVEPGDDGSQAH